MKVHKADDRLPEPLKMIIAVVKTHEGIRVTNAHYSSGVLYTGLPDNLEPYTSEELIAWFYPSPKFIDAYDVAGGQ